MFVHFLSAVTALTAGATVVLADGTAEAVAEGTASTGVADADATSPGFTSDALQPINAAAQQTIITVFFIILSPIAGCRRS